MRAAKWKIDSNKSFIGKVAKYVTGASGSLSGSYRHGNDFSNSHEQATNDNTSNSFRSENRSSISETLDSALRYAHDR
ncbi:MAG: hypothetical protein LRY43_00930, partial [Gammaproteobacteria bacterium]|nr:hypothetical protein [Gammaproteobacteria bacterium]